MDELVLMCKTRTLLYETDVPGPSCIKRSSSPSVSTRMQRNRWRKNSTPCFLYLSSCSCTAEGGPPGGFAANLECLCSHITVVDVCSPLVKQVWIHLPTTSPDTFCSSSRYKIEPEKHLPLVHLWILVLITDGFLSGWRLWSSFLNVLKRKSLERRGPRVVVPHIMQWVSKAPLPSKLFFNAHSQAFESNDGWCRAKPLFSRRIIAESRPEIRSCTHCSFFWKCSLSPNVAFCCR